jgi:nucleoside-diphosphate-sugar epimerase
VRVFVAGATGVIGVRLVPLLASSGHHVAGMTRSPQKAEALRALGAEPVVCDVFDAAALGEAVVGYGAEAVVHQLTDLPDDAARITEFGAANARIRREGTRNLLAAARAAGARRFVAQSVAWTLPGDAGLAVDELETAVLRADGVVVRYGQLYGPGTYFEGKRPPAPRVQVDAAARRTLPALDAASGVLTIVDDD